MLKTVCIMLFISILNFTGCTNNILKGDSGMGFNINNAREMANFIQQQINSGISQASIKNYSAVVIDNGSGDAVVKLSDDPYGVTVTVQNPNEIPLEPMDQVSIKCTNGNLNNAVIEYRKTINFDNIYVNYNVGADKFGRDSVGNQYGTIDAPFRTIRYAINRLPKNLNNRSVVINIQEVMPEGEILLIQGFHGGAISFSPTAGVLPPTTIIDSVTILNCDANLYFEELEWTGNFGVTHSNYVAIWNCVSTSATYNGVLFSRGTTGEIQSCVFSNKTVAIHSEMGSSIYSASNGGTSNSIGLQATENSVIGKDGTQPAGTLAEDTTGGSVIR